MNLGFQLGWDVPATGKITLPADGCFCSCKEVTVKDDAITENDETVTCCNNRYTNYNTNSKQEQE